MEGYRALYTSFENFAVSDFDSTWAWALTASLTLNLKVDRFWFHRSFCAVRCSFHNNMEDWGYKLRVIRYIPNILIQTRVTLVKGCGVLEEFVIERKNWLPANSSDTSENIYAVDWGNITGILRIISFWRNISFVPLSWPAITLVLLRKWWYFSTLMPFWFPRARGQLMFPRAVHISLG